MTRVKKTILITSVILAAANLANAGTIDGKKGDLSFEVSTRTPDTCRITINDVQLDQYTGVEDIGKQSDIEVHCTPGATPKLQLKQKVLELSGASEDNDTKVAYTIYQNDTASGTAWTSINDYDLTPGGATGDAQTVPFYVHVPQQKNATLIHEDSYRQNLTVSLDL